ncbi:isopeptide-forming domain-containing fimbrial protein, partial [Gemella cuniculi]|uniref:isopeptide-forming domain-containing fimbrial protein n=1 Tax=Gemella cuniculi TaxID=150240 RepID=UPI0004821A26
FKAKIKDGANLSKYIEEGTIKVPNKAKYKVNNNPEKDSNTVTVTPPPTNPEIKKTVNDKEHDQLGNVEDEFTYKIETKVPKNATALKITDELEKVLEFSGEVKATVDGKETKGEIKKEGQKLTVELTQEEITNNAEKEVKIEFKAKIKKDADLSSYVDSKDGRTKVPNKAKYQINNNPKIEKETPPVTVTPPPTTPEITKKVNEKEHVDLNKVDEEFTYKIETTVPENATDFEITDTIKDVLEFRGEVKATVDGEKIEEVKTEGKKLTVKLSREQVEQKVGKAVVVEFKAKLKEGVTQEELNAYLTKEEVRVPNTAEYRINLSDDPKLRKETPPVTVTPPPTTPEIEKTVNDKQEETLGSLSEEFTYKIKTKVPYNATKFKVEDEIKDVLEFSGEVSATVDGEKITDVTKQGQKLEVNLSEEQVKQKAGKEVYVEFKAKIKEGANLTQYIEEGTIKVPNVAKYIINDNPNNQKESNIVPVTPPPTTPPIDKKVNGKDKEILGERNQVVTYTIETKVPAAATYFEVEDTLEKVLEFTRGEKAKATLDGKELPESQVEIRGKTIKLKLTQEQVVEKTGKEVKLEFKANIEAGADLSPYIKEGKTSVPNKASYEINHEPKLRKESNIVPIEPPTRPTQPPITKEVNGKEKEELGRLDEEFTYTIRTTVPKNATEFKVTDALEKVLEFRGEVKATVDGKEVGKEQIHINGQNLEVELTREQVLQNGEKEVKVEFRAKIKDGADLTRYLVETKPSIPNKAQYIINNNPEFIKDSNIVPVTPPTPEPPKPGEKTINSENGEEQETIRQLKVGEEVFRYDIKAKLEENSYYKQFSIEDKLEEVLEARKATIRISGEQIEEDKELVELKELKEREKEIETKLGQTKANEAEGKQKELAKAEENLKELKEELGKQEEKETKEAKELEEKIAELKAGTKELASKEKEELEKELEKLKEEIRKEEETEKVKAIREINKALRSRNEKGEISEEEANKLGKLEKEGNKVRYEITNPQILRQLEGREIRLSIYAQIRNGADISKYNLKRVPNKATIEFDHKPKETNEVYVVPPVPPVTPPVVPPKPPVVPPTPEVPAKPKEEPKKPTEPKKELPKTGEGPVEGRWIGVIGLAIVGLIGRRRRREK